MARWIEITGTSKADLKAKAKKVSDKLHGFLEGTYRASRYAKLGSSIRLHKTQLKVIVKIPDTSHLWWRKIKNRTGSISNWATPKKIANTNTDYFNHD